MGGTGVCLENRELFASDRRAGDAENPLPAARSQQRPRGAQGDFESDPVLEGGQSLHRRLPRGRHK